MKKTLLALTTILTITILTCCIRTVRVNNTEVENETTEEETSEITTEEPSNDVTIEETSDSTTPESTSEEPTSTTSEAPTTFRDPETTRIPPILSGGAVTPNSINEHGKDLIVYGDIDPNDPHVLALQDKLLGYSKKISLAVWRKDGTRAISYNTNQTYFSACTIKIAYILNLCKIIDSGKVDPDTLITYEKKHYHKGSGKIKYSNYGTQYSVRTLINLCLSISDNVAYEMLSDYFGHTEYYEMIDSLGCSSLKLKGIWAYNAKVRDYIIIWNEVYNYFESGASMAEDLKIACTNTDFNYGTETLADDIDYSHKSGDNFGANAVYNDAGIVWTDNTYIYAVFTNSEGTRYDIDTVDTSMEHVFELMK